MIALIALMAMKRDGVPADFEAVYRSRDGQVMTLLSRTCFQMMLGERHVAAGIDIGVKEDFDDNSFGGFNEAPNGDYVAAWVGSKRLGIWGWDRDYYGLFAPASGGINLSRLNGQPKKAHLFQYGLSEATCGYRTWNPSLVAMVPRPRSDGDFGEVRIKLGSPDAQGRIHDIRVIMGRGTKNVILDDMFLPIMNVDKITTAGHWKSSQFSMDIEEDGGRVADLRGQITIHGVKYLIKGRRLGTRCAFGIINTDYGKPEGMGYVEWAPSGSRARKIMDRDESQTDHIVVGVSLPKEFPTGTEQVMDRAS